MRSATWAAVADVSCVLVFVVIGRASHSKGETFPGLASTSWPFLAGWRQPVAIVPAGVAAWLGAVAVGMVLRVIAGQGTALPFIVVALVFLGLFVVGWRLAARQAAKFFPMPQPEDHR
jgi:hypothetical protein